MDDLWVIYEVTETGERYVTQVTGKRVAELLAKLFNSTGESVFRAVPATEYGATDGKQP